MAEFLPLCDLLFNIVSLAAYFCDLVFDILVVYALYERGTKILFVQCLLTIILTTLLSQALSLHWYLARRPGGWARFAVISLHFIQMGVLWRYARLLMPVQLASVKRDVRDLCLLRLVHGFLQAAPMLLLQMTLLAQNDELPTDLLTVSASLSLFSVCWSLASFSKHVQSVERLVLTWLGVVSQLLWRGGTVTARAIALSAYAATYHSYIFLVLALHWACMFLWLLSPRSPFHGQRGKKLGVCALIAAIYILAYINLQGKPHGRTMTIFYIVMLLENLLLVGAWLAATWHMKPAHWEIVPLLTFVLFVLGIFFMLVYYKFFHVRRLMEKPAQQQPQGVFNCRFTNPTTNFYRKKKKPSSFVPPPGLGPMAVPFWRRPLPSSSETDGSIGSRVNIHQKLQEKKQKQLAELKIIEEEIKQGKLVGPEGADFDDRQPIPRTKRHQVEPQLLSLASLNNLASYGVNFNRRPAPRAPRSRTPELLLSPRYLYCDCIVANDEQEPDLQNNNGTAVASDLESQVSLPRSYTLPREFKYYRRRHRNGMVKQQRNTVQLVVNNYSDGDDGDVDSVEDDDDDDETDSCSNVKPALVRQLRRAFVRHETQL